MEGIRGLAVFLVFLVHYVTKMEPWLAENSFTELLAVYIRRVGNTGVDLFFVLSGFLIYGMLIKREQPFFEYFFARVRRIYPAFTVVFALYIGLSFLFPAYSHIPSQLDQAFIYLTQNFLLLPGVFDIDAMIGVAWSLSYEILFYICIPITITLFRFRALTAQQRVIGLIMVTILLFIGLAYFAPHHQRMVMFLAGMLVFEAVTNSQRHNRPAFGLLAFVIAIIYVVVLVEIEAIGWWKYLGLSVLFFALCFDSFTSKGITSRVFCWTPLRWLGNISYSYYLIHSLALKAFFLMLPVVYPAHADDVMIFWVLLPFVFLITLIPSIGLYLLVERPFSLSRTKISISKLAAPVQR